MSRAQHPIEKELAKPDPFLQWLSGLDAQETVGNRNYPHRNRCTAYLEHRGFDDWIVLSGCYKRLDGETYRIVAPTSTWVERYLDMLEMVPTTLITAADAMAVFMRMKRG